MPATTDSKAGEAPLARRLLWFVALWAGGVASVALVGFALKWLLRP
ncbi:hypothetical protein [Ferrovibrio sp.]|nr:hypothetical protein [Ferrovibrio sp.]MBP7063328.1 hypothetical protein [Ferrovibrio sp.]